MVSRGPGRDRVGIGAERMVLVVWGRVAAPSDTVCRKSRDVFESLFGVRESDTQVRAVYRGVRKDWRRAVRAVRGILEGLERGERGVRAINAQHRVVFVVW